MITTPIDMTIPMPVLAGILARCWQGEYQPDDLAEERRVVTREILGKAVGRSVGEVAALALMVGAQLSPDDAEALAEALLATAAQGAETSRD